MTEDTDRLWLERARALGAAQSRYLWFLLVAMVFFAAIHPHPVANTSPVTPLKVPILDLEIDRWLVLASGPVVLSFLVMAIGGSLRAYRRAIRKLSLGDGADWRDEAVDTHPNAIDLSLYTTPESPKFLATLAYFSYPAFLTAGLVQAACLWSDLLDWRASIRGWLLFVAAGAVLWLLGAGQVVAMWVKRVGRLRVLRETRDA
jgi:hypothetical protein